MIKKRCHSHPGKQQRQSMGEVSKQQTGQKRGSTHKLVSRDRERGQQAADGISKGQYSLESRDRDVSRQGTALSTTHKLVSRDQIRKVSRL